MPRWRNWQTHYLEVVAPRGMEVRVLSWAPFVLSETLIIECFFVALFSQTSEVRLRFLSKPTTLGHHL